MDFEQSEDQKMLAETVAAFGSKSSPVSRFRKLRNAQCWEPTVWKQMAELGWLSVPFPESAGGFGGKFIDVALVVEKLGATLVPEPFIPSVVLGGMALLEAGSAAQHARWLSPMIEGRTSLCLAYAERRARFDVATPETVASKHADGYRIRGEKVFVLNGHRADHLVVSARTDGGVGLFVVDRGATGLRIETIKTMDGHGAAMVRLEDVPIPSDRLLGDGARGSEVIDRVMDYGAAAAVAEGVGLCQTMLDMTVDYLKTREQFGVKIGVFQALQHRAVDMFVETQLMRSLSAMASGKVDAAGAVERKVAISAAKAHLSVSGAFVAQQAIQLHGGIGITDEHDIGLYFKRMHVLCTLFGDEQHHLERLTRLPGFAGAA
jgi:alkylation response protein AidB-like acyl-CoA dehydrogenase